MPLSVLVALLLFSSAASSQSSEYHFLRFDGKAMFLERVALNGQPVLSGTLISYSLPAYVTPRLRNGVNTLEIDYTSDTTEAMTIVLERRTPGPKKTELVRFHSKPAETGGKKVTKRLMFTTRILPRADLSLSETDRGAIIAMLQTYYDTLARRDVPSQRRFFEKTIQEYNLIYPEGVALFQLALESSNKVLASPQFQMKPFQRAGLQFTVSGQLVQVTRADRSPVIESNEVEVEEVTTTIRNGTQVRETQKVMASMRPRTVPFRKFDGRWYLALPLFNF